MNGKEIYKEDPIFWPKWLSNEEITRIIEETPKGENARRDIIIIAGMMFLGLSAKEAAAIRYCTVNGDAIERKGGSAFLHIPNAYRRMIYKAIGDVNTVPLADKIIFCTKKEAEEAADAVLYRAGFSAEIAALRLRRTAARLHYLNGWTWEGDILRWFRDIESIPVENKVLYYREETDEEIQKKMDEAILKMPEFV